jgi:hypothetical protein
MKEETISADLFSGYGHTPKTFAKGRLCREPGCNTILSVYNDGSYCYRHEKMSVPRTRGKRLA